MSLEYVKSMVMQVCSSDKHPLNPDIVEEAARMHTQELLEGENWSFLYGTAETTTTGDTGDYILRGAADDAFDVLNVKIASLPLDYRGRERFEQLYDSDQQNAVAPYIWTRLEHTVDNYPQIRIFGNAGAGQTLWYSYIKQVDPADPAANLETTMMHIILWQLCFLFAPAEDPNKNTYLQLADKSHRVALKKWKLRTREKITDMLDDRTKNRNYLLNCNQAHVAYLHPDIVVYKFVQ